MVQGFQTVQGGMSAECHRLWRGFASLVVVAAMVMLAPAAWATPYSYTTSGSIYSQSFDSLPSSGSSSLTGLGPFDTDAAPISAVDTQGWQFLKYQGNSSNALFSANTGGSTSGSAYSYGSTGSTDRSLGALTSGSGNYRLGMVLQNNTGETLTSFTLSYLGEQWRNGGSGNTDTLSFDYSIGSGTAINAGQNFAPVAGLDFSSPVTGAGATALDGNLPANQRAVSGSVSGLAWAAGDYLIIRWTDNNISGSDDGLALDNVSFTASGAAAGANLFWDGAAGWSETSPGAGGNGTWADGSGNWDASKSANFDGSAGTVTIAATATAQAGITFAADGYTLSGGTLALAGTENLLAVNPGITATIDSEIAGTTGLTKAGLGRLVLGGTNTFSGGLTLGSGTVSIATSAALGDAANALAFTGGTLQNTVSLNLGSRDISGAGSFDIAPGTTLTASGSVSLSGLTLSNTGTLALAGFSNAVGNISATAGSGTARVEGNLDFGTSGRTVTVADGGTLALAGSLTGTGILEKAGSGTLALAGDNFGLTRIRIGLQGATPVSGGTLLVSTSTALGADAVFFNNGTIQATEPVTFANGLSIGGRSTGTSRLAGDAMTFQGAIGTFSASGASGDITLVVDNDTTFAGDVTAAGTGITVGGSGTLRITGFASGLTAAVTLADTATLSVEGFAAVGSSLLTVGSGATLVGDGSVAALLVADGGTLTPGNGLGSLRAGSTTLAAGGNYNLEITDAAGTAGFQWDLLDVTGSIEVSATTADPFAVNLWSLSSINPSVDGDVANFDNQSGYAWTFARGTEGPVGFSSDKFTVNSAAINGTGGFTNDLAGGSFSVAASGNDLNVVFTPFVAGSTLDWYGDGATAGGSGSWTSLGATWSPDGGSTVGTWDPSRKAVFGGTAGTVTVQPAGITAARGLEFAVDGFVMAGGTLTLSGATADDNTITVGSGATASVAAPLAGTAGMTKAGPGLLVLSAANTISGTTTVAAGTLQVGDGTSGSLGGDVSVATGGRLAFNPGSPATVASSISGSGLVVKEGAGSLTLAGSSSYSGGTRLESGSLTASGFSALGSGPVTAVDGGLYAEAGASVSNTITVGATPGEGQTPVLLAGWDFQTTTSGGTAVVAAPNTPTTFVANLGTGTLHLDGTNGSSAWPSTELSGFTGTDVNAGAGFSTDTSSPAALALVGSAANGKQAVFAIDMTGYALLDVSYATRYSSVEGFTSQSWAVSTDGTTWQNVGSETVDSTTFTTKDLSTITALAGSSTAYLRLTVDGSTSATSNNRLDNVQLVATPGSLPSGTVVLGTEATSGTSYFSGNVVLNQSVALSAAAGGRAEFSGVISDSFGQNGITKTGAGTVVLGGLNTYAGPTAVNAGTLLVTGSTGGAAVTVANATLGGTGTVGPLLVNAGGQISPGLSGPATLAAGATTLAGGSSYAFQISDASGVAGSGWDLLDIGGGLTVEATQVSPTTIDLWTVTFGDSSGEAFGFNPLQPYRWTFLDTTESLASLDLTAFSVNASATATTGGFANNTQGGVFSIGLSTAGTGLDVVFTPDAALSSLVWYGEDASPCGKGEWTNLNINWFNGSALQAWETGKTAIFDTFGGDVTIGPAGISASNGISFEAAGYVVDGGTLTLSGSSSLVNTVRVAAGITSTIAAPVTGFSGMTKAGDGTLVLAADNTLIGGTVIAAGTLQLGGGGTAGSLPGDFSIGATGTLAVDRSDSLTIAGNITGAGGLSKQGAGTLTLTGANTYSGLTSVAAGTVVVGDGASSGGIATAGDLDLAAGSVLAFDRSDDVAFTGGVTGSGTLSQQGTGTLVLSRGTAYGNAFTLRVAAGTVNLDRSGDTLVGILGAGNTVELAGGTLQLTSNSGRETLLESAAIDVQADSTILISRTGTAGSHATPGFSTPITVANDATLSFDYGGGITEGFQGTTTYTAPVTLASSATFSVANSVGGTAEVIFADAVGDGGAGHGLTKAGPQQLSLVGVNTYSGATTVAAGTLAIGVDGTIDTSPLVMISSGATFDVSAKLAGYAVPAGQAIGGSGTLAGAMVLAAGSTVTPGDVVGTLTTSGDVTFGGGGNYNWQIVDALGTAGQAGGFDLVSVGGILAITATSADPFAINLWSLSSTDPVTSGIAANFTAEQAGSWTIASASGGITGFSADAFVVKVDAANGSDGFANPIGNGTFSLSSSGNDLNLIYTPGGQTNDIVIDVPSGSQTQTEAGYSQIVTADSVTKVGQGTLVMDAANSYTGPTTVSAGTLEVANAGALASTEVSVASGATLSVANGTTMQSPSVTLNGGTLAGGSVAVNTASGIETLTINSGTVASTTSVLVGAGGLVSLPVESRVTVGVASFSVEETAGGGLVDLGAGQVSVAIGGITAEQLRADIVAGRNGGGWNGTAGITSAAAASSGGKRAVGYIVQGDGSARVSFAAPGDINLSGTVDVFDLVGINNSNTYGTGAASVWSSGDFNYDNVTNVFDLVAIVSASAYGTGTYFPTAPAAAGLLGSVAAVPEPATLSTLLMGCLAALGGVGFAHRRRAG